MTNTLPDPSASAVEVIRQELVAGQPFRKRRIAEKFLVAAIGSIPWIGGFISAAASIREAEADVRRDDLQTLWLDEHRKKIGVLAETLNEIEDRFEKLGSGIEERIESQEFLGLVRQAFRTWDDADTAEKQRYAANVITNAAGTRLCSDDVVRLFIDWLELYHEVHFAVIRTIYQNPGATRFEIWTTLYGSDLPREDSAEADLFKLMIRDLSTGGVIRQVRDTDASGRFVRRQPPRRRGPAPATLESAFEDTKQYVLTELGKQFVHYTMEEIVTRLTAGGGTQSSQQAPET